MKYMIIATTELGKKALNKNREDWIKLPPFMKMYKKGLGYNESYSIEPGELLPKALIVETNKRIQAIISSDDFKAQIEKMMFVNGASKEDYEISEVKI
jgi:hypothetical protein